MPGETLNINNTLNIDNVAKIQDNKKNNLGLKELFVLVKTEFMNYTKAKAAGQMNDLNDRSEKINFLGNFLQIINMEVNSSGELDIKGNQDLKDILAQAKVMGVKLDETQEFFTKDEADALKSNISITIKGLTTKNDILMQQIIHLLQEGNLTQQFAKDNAKTLHDMLISTARAAGNR